MKKLMFATVMMALATVPQAAASCFCVGPPIETALKTSPSIFVGEVIAIDGPREVRIGDRGEQLYQVRFSVWERWKGAKGLEVEVLAPQKEQAWCFQYPAMRVGEIHLIFVDSINATDLPPKVDGIVAGCSNSTHLSEGSGLATILELDRLTRPAVPQLTPTFGRPQFGKGLCLFC